MKKPHEQPARDQLRQGGGVQRRDLLSGTTAIVAAAAATGTLPARAQAQAAQGAAGTAGSAATSSTIDRTVLPLPEPPFEGVIGKTYKESKEDWPKQPTPPEGAPERRRHPSRRCRLRAGRHVRRAGPTPELDKLAGEGLEVQSLPHDGDLRPLRAALITGRNHHNCGYGLPRRNGRPAFPATTA